MLAPLSLMHVLVMGCALVNTQTANSSSHVPLFLSNITLSASTATINAAKGHHDANVPSIATAKVPLRLRNITDNMAAHIPNLASIFFPNYNQQNVLELVRNIDTRLRTMRNVEMRVTTIQEIFDTMHFSGSLFSNANSNSNSNGSETPYKSTMVILDQNLQYFSKRLARKLQKATHVVLELRDFFRYNITNILQRPHGRTEYNEDDDFDAEFDMDADELNGSPSAGTSQNMNSYLSTYVQTCQDIEYNNEQNYNKQEIQILNYLKTEPITQHFDDSLLSENNDDCFEANALIMEKIQTLAATLARTDAFELPASTTKTPSNEKFKLLGNHFKHIYFLSRSDHASDSSENFYYDLHFRHLYVSAIRHKFVFLLIDIGAAMNAELLELTKSFVSNILQLLSDNDLISIVTIANEAKTMSLDAFPIEAANNVYTATRSCKDEILNFINNLSITKEQTNHQLGFEYAFKLLQKLEKANLTSPDQPTEFVYITRGLLSNLSDATHVVRVIAHGQQTLREPIVINTCAVVLDEKRIMYEKQFLNDIAAQNYTKYDIKLGSWKHAEIGKFIVLTKMHPELLVRASTAIFENAFKERYLSESLEVHEPVVDATSKDVIVSVTHTVSPFGVVGVNLYLSDLIEDIVNYYQHDQGIHKGFTYAFLIDRKGIAIAHPAFPRPIAQSQTPFPVDIGFLENSTNFGYIRRQMLQEENGNVTTTIPISNSRQTEIMNRSYHWQSVLGIYVLCLVTTSKREPSLNVETNKLSGFSPSIALGLHHFTIKQNLPQFHNVIYENLHSANLLYHRLDLVVPQNAQVCRYFHQVATMDAATLFLGASAFESPFTFLQSNRGSSQKSQLNTVESIMVYIKDSTGLIANPGLRPQIRHEVNVLYNAMHHLKKRHQDARGSLKPYIIRRYIATVNGVLQVYPGCLLSDNYDPTRRPWFRKAMQQPGKIITTEPYLDAGGAGYIISIAHTIFEGKTPGMHSAERDQPVAIVALDLPYAFYYRMILESTPLCQQSNIKCLLFENEGFIVAHPSMLEPSTPLRNQRRPHEHLTHKESYLANDILNHKALVRKLVCANYQNRTLQRYYMFNTSLSDIVTNMVHGERTKYAIALVRGSNVFAAVLNSTCDGGAFCPCSTIDRTCLNCNRMDQMDCECPCECPMELELFDETTANAADPFINYTQQYSYCVPPNEHFVALPAASMTNMLSSCVNINCDAYSTQGDCLAVMGCEWCQQDLDGNGFATSFCTAQTSCFNGILSSLTPYGDMDDIDTIAAHGYNPGQKQNSYSAFGPVGGAIVILAIVIGFAVYCYRHNLDAHSQEQFYIDSMQEENYGLPLSRFNFDDCQAHDDPPGNIYDHPSAQRNLMHPADVSPYHMSTGSSYRRPPNGESDHGYSTMTPHEDSSDHQCFTLAEPLLLNEKRHSKSDTLSISTSISSPTNRHQQHYHNPYLSQPTPTSTTKDAAARYITSPKKLSSKTPSPARFYEQTVLPMGDANEESMSPHYILAPVTVHRHMETSES